MKTREEKVPKDKMGNLWSASKQKRLQEEEEARKQCSVGGCGARKLLLILSQQPAFNELDICLSLHWVGVQKYFVRKC